tara:strand:- start:6134 stop:6727 length:594 start_codon:yes stop_codon:yes gene_type:complete
VFINENYLKLQHKLKSDRQVVKVGDDSSGLLLKDNRVYVEQEPSEEQEVATKKYVDNFKNIINGGFNYSYTAGTKVYLPLNGYIIESSGSSGRNEYQVFVSPYDGYLNQVIMRSEEACGSTVVGLHKSSAGTEIPNNTASATVTVDMAEDDIAYKFDFTSDNTFVAGDVLAISFDPTNDANDTIFAVEFILNSIAGL